MKKVILTIAILFIASTAGATIIQNVNNNKINSPTIIKKTKNVYKTKEFKTYVNEETTINEAKKKRFEVGVGADVTIFEDKSEGAIINKVTEEYRYDWANGEHQAYTVAHINLWQKIKSFFSGTPWESENND